MSLPPLSESAKNTIALAARTSVREADLRVHSAILRGAKRVHAAFALRLLQEVRMLQAKVEPQNADHDLIVYALERARDALDEQANKLHDAHDYSAEFPYEDARRMDEAIAILRKPKRLSVGPWGVSRVMDNDQALLVSFRAPPTDDDLRNLHELIRENAP